MLNREGLERDCTLAIEHFADIDKAREYINEEFATDYTASELEEVFDEVVNKREEQILSMDIVVKNNGEEVHCGIAREWLDNNGGDEDVLDLITECYDTGKASRSFVGSGYWEISKAQ